jgi:sugar phosphate isomerase/epimerase
MSNSVTRSRIGELPLISVSQVTTLTASFADDVRMFAASGLDGIGIWEMKLGDVPDDDALALVRDSGLGSATAVPAVPSILPLPLMPGPERRRERVDAILRSLHRLAPFQPAAVLCVTGPGHRADALDGLREVSAEAEALGLRIALEPFQREGIENWSIANTLDDAAAIVDEIGSPALGLQFDVWHQWNTLDLLEQIERHAHLIAGVHVSDWREPTRGWADRVLPGDGVAGVPTILGALERAGWDGFYDIEIFSDNGSFGAAYPDSLWDEDPADVVNRARQQLLECWEDRRVAAMSGPERRTG